MIENIEKWLSQDCAEKCAKEIMERFRDGQHDVNKEIVDYEYDLQKGEIVLDEEENVKNTSYLFDPDKGSTLYELIETFIHDDETRLPDIGDFEKLDEFLSRVAKIIEENYSDVMRDAARRRVLGGASEELFPLKGFKVQAIDLSNPVIDFNVRVSKAIMVKKSVLAEAKSAKDIFKNKPKEEGVGNELGEIHIKTGKSFEQIIAEKKAFGDPRYANVIGASKEKAYYKVCVEMWLDYTIVRPEEGIIDTA